MATADKLSVIWITGNYHDCKVMWERIISGESECPIKIKDPNVMVVDCGRNPENISHSCRMAAAGDIIKLLKNTDIFDKRQRVIKMKGLPSDYTILADYLTYTSPNCVLVIDSPTAIRAKPPSKKMVTVKNSKFFKTIKSKGYLVEFPTDLYKVGDAATWVKKAVEDFGKKIQPDAARLLVDMQGHNLDNLYTNIFRLVDYQKKTKINKEDVAAVCSAQFLKTTWDLLRSLDERDYDKAIGHLQEFYRSSTDRWKFVGEVQMMLGAFNKHFTFIMIVKDYISQDAKRALSYNTAVSATGRIEVVDKGKKGTVVSIKGNADENKKKIISIASGKKPKPATDTSLGAALIGYTNKGCNFYDSVFDKKIRNLRPDWFPKMFDGRFIKANLDSPAFSWYASDLYRIFLDINTCRSLTRQAGYNLDEIKMYLDTFVMEACHKIHPQQVEMLRIAGEETGVV